MKQVIIILMLIFLISCTSFNQRQTPLPAANVGTKALEITFLENTPPEEVAEKERFEVGVKVSNEGATHINKGYYSFAYPTQWIRIDAPSGVFQVKGKEQTNPYGDFREIMTQGFAYQMGAQQEVSDKLDIVFTSCFPYSTKAGLPVCIDTEPTKKDVNKACQLKILSFSGGQGGPVAVTQIETRMQPTEQGDKAIPRFVLTLQNQGKGFVIDENAVNLYCGGKSVDRERFDVVNAQVLLGENVLNCKTNTLTLKNEQTELICELPSGIDKRRGAYTSFLDVELNYGYVQTAVKSTRVRKQD